MGKAMSAVSSNLQLKNVAYRKHDSKYTKACDDTGVVPRFRVSAPTECEDQRGGETEEEQAADPVQGLPSL